MEMNNNAVYHGCWNEDGKRMGKGTQIWIDGSKYVGYWEHD